MTALGVVVVIVAFAAGVVLGGWGVRRRLRVQMFALQSLEQSRADRPLEEAGRRAETERAYVAAVEGDDTALDLLRVRAGGFGVKVFETWGSVGPWGTETARHYARDAYARAMRARVARAQSVRDPAIADADLGHLWAGQIDHTDEWVRVRAVAVEEARLRGEHSSTGEERQ